MIVADSDMLIDALRGRQPALDRIAIELKAGALATTVVTVFELLSGARSATEERKVEQLLAGLTVLGLDGEAATAAAKVRRALEGSGQKIGMVDYLIAGICITRSAILLTNNRKHFERVPDLRLSPVNV